MHMYSSFQQLWTVVLWLTQAMAELVTLPGQHLDRQPPTVVIQATRWWETVFARVKLQEYGLEVHPPANVCCYWSLSTCVSSEIAPQHAWFMSVCCTLAEGLYQPVAWHFCNKLKDKASPTLPCSLLSANLLSYLLPLFQVVNEIFIFKSSPWH